eukprot:SAG31_NODE_2546_length_5531_cov_1.748159_3_plen_77_part_00
MLEVGEIVKVTETATVGEPAALLQFVAPNHIMGQVFSYPKQYVASRTGKQLRVRFDRGWTSVVATTGQPLLKELKL